MNHSRYRSNGYGLGELLGRSGLAAIFGATEDDPQLEAMLREVRAREVMQKGMAKSKLDMYRGAIEGHRSSLRNVNADVAQLNAALSVESRPAERAQLQAKLNSKLTAQRQEHVEINNLQEAANQLIAQLRAQLEKLHTSNRIEMGRIRSRTVQGLDSTNVDTTAIAHAFGTKGEMSFLEDIDKVEVISFAGVTYEGEGKMATNNLTPGDVPYYMEQDESEFQNALGELASAFKNAEQARRNLIDAYHGTGDEGAKTVIERDEPRFLALRRDYNDLREVANQRANVEAAGRAGNIPSATPLPMYQYENDLGNRRELPVPRPRRGYVSMPIRKQQLKPYVPHIKELIKESNALRMDYNAGHPSSGKPRGWSENANDHLNEYEARLPKDDLLVLTTVGTKDVPPAWKTGRMPPSPQDTNTTLSGMVIRSSGDLGNPGRQVIGEVREIADNIPPIYEVERVHRKTAKEIIDETMRKLHMTEGAH